MTLISKALLVASALIVTMPAMAAVQVTNSQGRLTGATGVIVGANLYNVEFVEGSCNSLFANCQSSAFTFRTQEDATLAANALLDQVLVDSEKGNFDKNVGLTFGCNSTSDFCRVLVPFAEVALPTPAVSTMAAINISGTVNAPDRTQLFTLNKAGNTSQSADVYTKFSFVSAAPTPAIPEPTTWAMMLVGFGMIGAATRYRRRLHNVTFA